MSNTVVYQLGNALYINLTNRCSNACEFCIRLGHKGVGTGKDLWLEREPTSEEVIAAFSAFDLAQFKEAVFCGFGEPVYRVEEIISVARFLQQNNIKVRLNTNGQGNLINGRDITKELCAVIDSFNISLNAPDAKGYDAICHSEFGENAFFAMLDFAKKCIDCGREVILSVVDTLPKEDICKAEAVAREINAVFRVRQFE